MFDAMTSTDDHMVYVIDSFRFKSSSNPNTLLKIMTEARIEFYLKAIPLSVPGKRSSLEVSQKSKNSNCRSTQINLT